MKTKMTHFLGNENVAPSMLQKVSFESSELYYINPKES